MLSAHSQIFCTHARAPVDIGCCKGPSHRQIDLSVLKIQSSTIQKIQQIQLFHSQLSGIHW